MDRNRAGFNRGSADPKDPVAWPMQVFTATPTDWRPPFPAQAVRAIPATPSAPGMRG